MFLYNLIYIPFPTLLTSILYHPIHCGRFFPFSLSILFLLIHHQYYFIKYFFPLPRVSTIPEEASFYRLGSRWSPTTFLNCSRSYFHVSFVVETHTMGFNYEPSRWSGTFSSIFLRTSSNRVCDSPCFSRWSSPWCLLRIILDKHHGF